MFSQQQQSDGYKQMVDFLADEYAAAAREQGLDPQQCLSEIEPFLQFARDYIQQNPVAYIDRSMDGGGLKFANEKLCTIGLPQSSPGAAGSPGAMQPSSFVPASGNQTAREIYGGAAPQPSKPIPPGLVDFTQQQPARDMKQQQPAQDMAQKQYPQVKFLS